MLCRVSIESIASNLLLPPMDSLDRLDNAYRRLSAELSEKKSLRAELDAEIGDIANRLQKLDDARVIVAEMGGGGMTERQHQIPVESKNKVRELVLSFINSSPLNLWLPASAILDALKQRGYEAPISRNSAYASVYVTVGRLVMEGLIADADGARGKVFAKLGSTPNAAPGNESAFFMLPPGATQSERLWQLPDVSFDHLAGVDP